MNDVFNRDEKLYRAIYPPEIAPFYWKSDGSLSHYAFMDPKGLSVDRGDYREDAEVVSDMKERLDGIIARIYVYVCNEAGAVLKYLPSKNNPYHSEIHGSREVKLLSRHQCLHLAKKAEVVS